MADGILIDPGTSEKVATDDCGAAGHAQIWKLATSADGDATLVDVGGLLTSIKAAVETIDNMIAGTEGQVDVVTSALPSGAATSAKQDTIIGHVDGIEAALTAIQGYVDGLEGYLATVAGAVAGTEVQVDVVAALPAGTNAIGKLAANSGVDIGDVDVTSVPADPFGANADAAATAGSTGSIQAKLRLMTSQLDAIKTALEILDDWDSSDRAKVKAGEVAHDAAATSVDPTLIGGYASEDEPTAVSADGDSVRAWFDRTGRQIVLLGHADPEPPVAVNVTADGQVIAAPGASVSLYIKKGSVHNRASSTVLVALEDGSGGTERWRAEVAADGGGSLFDFGERGWKLTANTALYVDLTGGSLDVDINITEYYIAP